MLGVPLLLLGLLAAAPAGASSGPRECARGPAAWCRDLQAAARCGAVGHCRSAVWSQPPAKSLPCDLCLDVAAAASQGLNAEATGADALAAVRETCGWLPGPEPAAGCRGTVDAHGAAILSMLRGAPGRAPGQVCSALSLCRPPQRHPAAPGPLSEEDVYDVVMPFVANGLLSVPPQRTPASTVCRDCVQLVARLQGALGPSLSSLAEATTREQCASLGPGLALLCENYVQQLVAPAERTLSFTPPRELCTQESFCEAPEAPARWTPMAAADGVPDLELASPRKTDEVQMQGPVTCDVCLQLVQKLDRWLESSSSQTLISQALERVCSVLPRPAARQCVKVVDTYLPSLVDLLSGIAPQKMCTVFRLCGRRRQARAVREGPAAPPPRLLDRDSLCRGCRRLLGLSARSLERKSTERRILRAFKIGCGVLPLPFMVQCGRFVSEYQPVLMGTLRDMMEPLALCTRLGACRAPGETLLGTDQCVLGPSFWCHSREAARMCDAVEHCQRRVWKEPPLPTEATEATEDRSCPGQELSAPETAPPP